MSTFKDIVEQNVAARKKVKQELIASGERSKRDFDRLQKQTFLNQNRNYGSIK